MSGPTDRPLRVLVLTSSTGGGHDARARALRDWAALLAPSWEVRLHQALEETHALYRFGVGIYNTIQRAWPGLHHIYYNVLEAVSFAGGGKSPATVGGSPAGAAPTVAPTTGFLPGSENFQKVVRDFRPDIVISTHDHLNHGFLEAARAALPQRPPKCATYCGELSGGYGFSRHWVNPSADLFIGAVDECCEAARALGLPPERAWTGGFLLDPAFWTPRDDDAEETFVRGELGLDPARFTLLLSTGANSAHNHVAWLDALAAANLPAPVQVAALCGRDERARAAVEQWAAAHPAIPVRALPRVDNLALLMRVASAVVTRPGTGTTSEAILCGTPILFNTLGGIMPQEMITVKFAREHGFGQVLRAPRELADALRAWYPDPVAPSREPAEQRAAEAARTLAAAPKNHPSEILVRLAALV